MDSLLRFTVKHHKYLFHLHTTFSDGYSTVEDYCAYALANGYRVLVFTEHVRKDLDYDWLEYVESIGRARMMFPGLELWTGCEAKVLLDGTLDMPDNLPGLDLVCMAEHGDYGDRGQWTKALLGALDLDLGLPLVWVHPFRWLVAQEHRPADVLRQSRHIMGLQLDMEVLNTLDEKYTIVGRDAHSVDDID